MSFCGSSIGFRCKQEYQRDRQANQTFQARRKRKLGNTLVLTRPPVLPNMGRVRRGHLEEENRELTRVPVSASLEGRVKPFHQKPNMAYRVA